MKDEHRQIVLSKMGRKAANAMTLLESLYFRPIVTVEHVQEITKLTFPNANVLVKELCNLGLLREITGQRRNRAFAYDPYLNVFEDS